MDEKMILEEYERLRNTDIRTVAPEDVVDVSKITVDLELPPEQRMVELVRQMNGNPFVYRCGDILVKTSFAGTASLQSVLEECLEKR